VSNDGSTLEKNRIGPYTILRRLRGVTTASEVGRVYNARHRTPGRPALVVRGVSQEHFTPTQEWRMRVRAGTQPEPYLALEVERAPEGDSALSQLDAGLDVLVCALEGLERHAEVAAHLSGWRRPAAPTKEPSLLAGNWRWAAVAALLAVGVLAPRAWRAAHAPGVQPEQEAAVAVAEEVLAEPQALPVAAAHPRTWTGLGINMPKKPFPGQYRPEKDGKCKARLEVPINGGCWVELAVKAPCGDDAYEHAGRCYWPSMPAPKEPSSIIPRPTPVPAAR